MHLNTMTWTGAVIKIMYKHESHKYRDDGVYYWNKKVKKWLLLYQSHQNCVQSLFQNDLRKPIKIFWSNGLMYRKKLFRNIPIVEMRQDDFFANFGYVKHIMYFGDLLADYFPMIREVHQMNKTMNEHVCDLVARKPVNCCLMKKHYGLAVATGLTITPSTTSSASFSSDDRIPDDVVYRIAE